MTFPPVHREKMAVQFDSSESLHLRYGFSRVDKPLGDYRTHGVKSTRVSFQAARQALKNSPYSTLYLAWRSGRSRTYQLGEYRKDRLGRIRFYEGWPALGKVQVTSREVFK